MLGVVGVGLAQGLFAGWRAVLPVLALVTSACQTIDNGSATNPWQAMASVDPSANAGVVPKAPLDDGQRNTSAARGVPLGTEPRREQTAFMMGTGRFIGDANTERRPQNRVEANEDGVTINLVNVPVAQAAKTILNDILAVKYTVDPKIDGKVTIQTPNPVAKAEAVDLFQAALRANGASIISANGLFRIVPADQAVVGASFHSGGKPALGPQLGSHIQLVPLKYVSASEIRRILEPIAPRGSIVRADDARNMLTLSGDSEVLAPLLEAIAIFDVDVMKGMSFALVPVKTSQPDTIAEELKTVFGADREGPMAGMVRFIPN